MFDKCNMGVSGCICNLLVLNESNLNAYLCSFSTDILIDKFKNHSQEVVYLDIQSTKSVFCTYFHSSGRIYNFVMWLQRINIVALYYITMHLHRKQYFRCLLLNLTFSIVHCAVIIL